MFHVSEMCEKHAKSKKLQCDVVSSQKKKQSFHDYSD